MSKFEKKFGKYAIHNLTMVLIMCYVAGYVIELMGSAAGNNLLGFLTLDPYRILHGQIWRLVTWVIVPPDSLDIFTIIMLLFYYNLGTALERTWGTYRYNVYIFSGMLFTIAGSFLCMGVLYLLTGGMATETASVVFYSGSYAFSTYYINLSIFLAFAATYPDMQVLLMFVIPVKVKWMGISGCHSDDLYRDRRKLIYQIRGSGITLLNFVLYFYRLHRSRISPKQMHRKAQFERKSNAGRAKVTRHKCAVCGRTEEDDPNLEFRFCSKCNGNYEYCQYHLFTHEHIK
ncbi:MAG: hypothetical protein V8Q05_08110 [Lachnospiraceae bacterium]